MKNAPDKGSKGVLCTNKTIQPGCGSIMSGPCEGELICSDVAGKSMVEFITVL